VCDHTAPARVINSTNYYEELSERASPSVDGVKFPIVVSSVASRATLVSIVITPSSPTTLRCLTRENFTARGTLSNGSTQNIISVYFARANNATFSNNYTITYAKVDLSIGTLSGFTPLTDLLRYTKKLSWIHYSDCKRNQVVIIVFDSREPGVIFKSISVVRKIKYKKCQIDTR
jgi:hypothetical protein